MLRSYDVAFGEKFRQKRLQAGLTQVEVVERLAKQGVQTGQGYIADIERGRYVPKEEMRRALAKAVGVSVDEMESLVVEAKLEELGVDDPAFTLMFKDVPTMTPEEKSSLLRVYFDDILPARRKRQGKN